MKRVLIGLILFLGYSRAFINAQAKDPYAFSNKIFDIQFLYNYHVPGGTFTKTYGNFNSVGTGGMLKLKNNWISSLEVNYIFGGNILEEHLLDNLLCSGNYIANSGGAPGNYSVNMRGYTAFLKAGRLLSVSKKNMNSGFLITGGVGFMQHRINIQTQNIDIPQLDVNYKKGYDRFSNGIAFSEFAGYCFHSSNKLINFYIGAEFIQNFAHNKREFNFDQAAYDKGAQKNFTTSFRFGWMIPIYLRSKEEDEFYFR